MKIFINDRMEIHDVDSTSRTDLIEVNVTDGTFDSWSKAKICCYCANVRGGKVVELYPYVNTIVIEQLDRIGALEEETSTQLTDTQMAVCDNFEEFMEYAESTDNALDVGNTQITDLEMAVCELYEIIGG